MANIMANKISILRNTYSNRPPLFREPVVPYFNQANVPQPQLSQLPLNLLQEEISLPALILCEDQLQENIAWMQNFTNERGLFLAPHGKTTMCPFLFHRQLQAGAWAISLATAKQVAIAHTFQVRRILLANQLVGKANMDIISEILLQDPQFEFACLAESSDNVEQLAKHFAGKNLKLRILLEFSYPGGRTGIRNDEEEAAVIEAISKYPKSLALVGVEFYEAMCQTEGDVRTFMRRVVNSAKKLMDAGKFTEKSVIISAAGSCYLDIVAEELVNARTKIGVARMKGVVRPGSYLTHEVGTYQGAKLRMLTDPGKYPTMCTMRPALSIWAFVQSLPEPGLAVVTMGKRNVDATFDTGFPIPTLHFRHRKNGQGFHFPTKLRNNCHIRHVMDQHAFLVIDADNGDITDKENENGEHSRINVGDIIAFETPYPGTTMDKYPNVVVVDNNLDVLYTVKTYFE